MSPGGALSGQTQLPKRVSRNPLLQMIAYSSFFFGLMMSGTAVRSIAAVVEELKRLSRPMMFNGQSVIH